MPTIYWQHTLLRGEHKKDPGPGGGITHRADEAQQPSPGERLVRDGCSSCSDRDSLHRAERGTVRLWSTDNQPTGQESAGSWESLELTLPDSQGVAPQAGLSPMFTEGKRLPQDQSLCWLRRSSSGPCAQHDSHRLCSCFILSSQCSQYLAQKSGPSLGSPDTPTTLAYRALACLGSLNSPELTQQSRWQGGRTTTHCAPWMLSEFNFNIKYKPQRHSL